MQPLIDHLVIDVRDRLREEARRLRALSFTLRPLGRHSLGSVNHLAMFGQDYLELLGTDVPGGALRPDIAPYPVGLNGLVFRGEELGVLRAGGVPGVEEVAGRLRVPAREAMNTAIDFLP